MGQSRDRIRVYSTDVDCLKDPTLYQRALDLIPAARREYANRMKVESGKRLSAGAGLLLMAALADYRMNDKREYAAFHELRFEKGEQGKPALADYPDVHFNLSHSGNRVLCIVGPVDVGCDVEVINPSHVKSVIRCFAESEQILASRSAEDFFRIWTLKESIVKLSGQGMQIPFRSFEVSLDPLSVRQGFLPEPVVLKEYTLDAEGACRKETEIETERYCASCAACSADLPDEMIRIDLAGLLEEA